jgi:hypothetical protein
MGWPKFGWGKIRGIFGLKALALAFFMTPATVAAPPLATPAVAQIGIFIPGIRFYGGGGSYRGRGGGRRHRGSGRRRSRGGGGGGGGSEASAPASGKGVRGNSD